MEKLIDATDLQKILERGLVTGKWSIQQFNGRDYKSEQLPSIAKQSVLPSAGFLRDHPQFLDMKFRDLDAYSELPHRSAF